MATTANGLVTPELSDAPNGPGGLLAMAQSVDARYGPTVADWTALLAVATPFTGMRVFVTSLGDFAFYNGTKWIAPEFTVRKTADESVSSGTTGTTLQNDNELLYPVAAAGDYVFNAFLWAVSAADAAGDIKLGFTFPTGTLHFGGAGLTTALASGAVGDVELAGFLSATSGTTTKSGGLSTTTQMIWLHGILIATATGTLQLQWAQLASNASASTIKAGSHMLVKQVA